MEKETISNTYLLCGLYKDNIPKDQKKEIHTELKRRWNNKICLEGFYKYFEAWGLNEKDFNLNGEISIKKSVKSKTKKSTFYFVFGD